MYEMLRKYFELKCPECGEKDDHTQILYDAPVAQYRCNKCRTYFNDKIASNSPR